MKQYTPTKKKTRKDCKSQAIAYIIAFGILIFLSVVSTEKITFAIVLSILIFLLLYVSAFSKKRRYVNNLIFDDLHSLLTIIYLDQVHCKEIEKTIPYCYFDYSYRTAFVYVGSGWFYKVLQIKEKKTSKLIVELNPHTGFPSELMESVYLKIKEIG